MSRHTDVQAYDPFADLARSIDVPQEICCPDNRGISLPALSSLEAAVKIIYIRSETEQTTPCKVIRQLQLPRALSPLEAEIKGILCEAMETQQKYQCAITLSETKLEIYPFFAGIMGGLSTSFSVIQGFMHEWSYGTTYVIAVSAMVAVAGTLLWLGKKISQRSNEVIKYNAAAEAGEERQRTMDTLQAQLTTCLTEHGRKTHQ